MQDLNKKRRTACYARVSTSEQSKGLDAQVRALRIFCEQNNITSWELFADEAISGTKASRPGLDRMMKAVENDEIENVIVFAFSRYARSVTHMLKGLEVMRAHKTNFVSLSEKFDPFSPRLTNFNQILSGGSGAGKSFCANLIIAQLMKERPKVFIVDIGGSYRKMTEHFGGQYIPIGTDSSLSLNPFDLTERNPTAVDQKIKFMTSLVELMTREEGAVGIGKLERAEIESAVKEILESNEPCRISALRTRLLTNQDTSTQKIGKILGPWCGDSPYGKFVDRQTNLELHDRIVCFDLKGLETHPDLQAVCLFLITDLIWREVQLDRTTPKFVVLDECWSLLDNDAGAKFLGEVFRTFRKYRASAIAISQTMDDFANSKVSQAILPNASVKWILKQTGGNLPALQEILRLNDREMKIIESVASKKGQFSEAFLIAGDDRQVVVIRSTPLEYWLATTDPMDLRAMDLAQKEYPNISNLELLEKMAEKYPVGIWPLSPAQL
jgi:conjugal transfer ATP-binding protein TraC